MAPGSLKRISLNCSHLFSVPRLKASAWGSRLVALLSNPSKGISPWRHDQDRVAYSEWNCRLQGDRHFPRLPEKPPTRFATSCNGPTNLFIGPRSNCFHLTANLFLDLT